MARTVAIGYQEFDDIIKNNLFYIDKTYFIKDWFSNIKETTYLETKYKICKTIQLIYRRYSFLLEGKWLSDSEKADFNRVTADMADYEASLSLMQLSEYLYRYYGKKVIILLDEYDTPLQEAYVNGYWQELSSFMRNFLNATFKGNNRLEPASCQWLS